MTTGRVRVVTGSVASTEIGVAEMDTGGGAEQPGLVLETYVPIVRGKDSNLLCDILR